VDIKFGQSKFRKLANDVRKCQKEFGVKKSTLFFKRLTYLREADTLEDIRNLPGGYHELVGDRKGQWACDLDHPYRLIFTPQENPIPVNESGQYIWIEIMGIEVVEIVDYH
jgi:proteic killer suppression protein